MFGGLTLASAYALGAPALPARGAAPALVVLGGLQMLVGLSWILRAAALRRFVLRRPGLFVLLTLSPGLLVMVLGGSNHESLFVTAAMAWFVAAGYALPGYRWPSVAALGTVVVGALWAGVEGAGGGYLHDGDYTTAFVGLASFVVAGLWLGRTVGLTSGTLNRWHLVEIHDRGLVARLREQIARVDEAAGRVAELLPTGASASRELSALRARLRLGIGLRADDTPTTLGRVVDELVAEHASADPAAVLRSALDPRLQSLELATTTADVVASVLRRQLANVVRHAPTATVITLGAAERNAVLRLWIEDDGPGSVPVRAGTGTAWSVRQLERVGGGARYYAGEQGVGFEVTVPVRAGVSISGVPGLSVSAGLDRFAVSMIGGLRFAGYVGDSLAAYVTVGGTRWLVMPAAAVAIELVLHLGLPRLRLAPDTRVLVAALIAIGTTLVFTVPADSPDVLVPATTSVVVLAHLLLVHRPGWWVGVEVLRTLAVAPLLLRHGSSAVELLLIYPAGINLIVFSLDRFVERARGLDRTAADAMGRAALAGAAVRGLALHHDAVDVILRGRTPSPELRDAMRALQEALAALDGAASGPADPREAMLTGIQAALVQPVVLGRVDETRAPATQTVAGAIDRVTLIELAALAADERATCAPPGLFGRRRLRTLQMDWSTSIDGARLTLVARPMLRPPDERSVRRLRAVADGLGITVDSTPGALTLVYDRR